ncbi:hypothetical protein RYX36_010882 [Vicia faba]
MANAENLDAKIEQLLNMEKQMRLAGEIIVVLSKRRGQLKQAVTAMVQQAMQYIDETPDVETRIELIKTLNSVSAGKIYVEIERARLVKKLAKIKKMER